MNKRSSSQYPSETTVPPAPADRLKNALKLALEVESALLPFDMEQGAKIDFQLRLARAQVLGAIDVLTDIVRGMDAARLAQSGVYSNPVSFEARGTDGPLEPAVGDVG